MLAGQLMVGFSVSFTVTVNATGTWLGTESEDWFNGLNWWGGVPDETKDVIIPSTLVGTHYPSIDENGAECKSLTIQTGASMQSHAWGVPRHVHQLLTTRCPAIHSLP